MDLERIIKHTLEIQAIPAPTFSEGARAAWIHRKLNEFNLPLVELDPVGNVYGRIPGGDQLPVVISAHLDNVFPIETSLKANRTSNRLLGPGIGDNAVALATLLELAEDLQKMPLPGDVWLIATVGEEGLGNLLGMRQVVSRFQDRVTAYVVLEGMALGHIYHKGLPVRRYRITAQGPGGHSWIHHGRASALHTLIEIAHKIIEVRIPTSPKTTLNIGLLHGGTTVNSIARLAYFELDLRSESESELEKLATTIEDLLSAHKDQGIQLRIKAIGERPGGQIAEDHPLVEAAKDALKSVGESQIYLEAGSTDASVPLSMGFPAFCVGVTRGGGAHSMEEFIEIDPIPRGYKSILLIVAAAFEVSGS
ncbi:MAG: M20/M25/M40 family metallo-hydrolase [Anaerolineales bacterium]|nr:M20/M25/M40 family metallo-hydrolase [Anaerolineales bacterium]